MDRNAFGELEFSSHWKPLWLSPPRVDAIETGSDVDVDGTRVREPLANGLDGLRMVVHRRKHVAAQVISHVPVELQFVETVPLIAERLRVFFRGHKPWHRPNDRICPGAGSANQLAFRNCAIILRARRHFHTQWRATLRARKPF